MGLTGSEVPNESFESFKEGNLGRGKSRSVNFAFIQGATKGGGFVAKENEDRRSLPRIFGENFRRIETDGQSARTVFCEFCVHGINGIRC